MARFFRHQKELFFGDERASQRRQPSFGFATLGWQRMKSPFIPLRPADLHVLA